MGRSGFIMRFVDVVLILLFGFISIAEIKQSEIDVPDSSETPPSGVDTEEVVFVGILPDGTYLLDEEQVAVRDVRELRSYLLRQQRRFEGAPLKVRIRSAHDAPVKYAMQAARLCDDLGIPKALEVQMSGVE